MIRKLNNTYNLHNDSTNMIFNTKCQSIIPKTIPLTVATTIFFSENNELPSTASFKDRRYTFVAFGDKVRRAGYDVKFGLLGRALKPHTAMKEPITKLLRIL